MTITIRGEEPGDERAIRALTDAAFQDMPYADGDEGQLIEKLRADGHLALSLVAVNEDKAIVGHIGFSPVSIERAIGRWYQLAPVSVIPSGQNSGIGSKLIEAGLDRLRTDGASGILLVGNPDYYARFGFVREHTLTLSDAMNPFLQMLVFAGDAPSGQVTLAPAFG